MRGQKPIDAPEEIHPTIQKALEYIRGYQYRSFFELFASEKDKLSGEDLGELYVLRSRIKMFYSDPSIAEDLRIATRLLPQGSRLSVRQYLPEVDTPALFTYLNAEPSSIADSRNAMIRSPLNAQKSTDPSGYNICQLFDAEICYLVGNMPKALRIALPLYETAKNERRHLLFLLVSFVLIRCYVGQGEGTRARKLMLEIKNLVKTNPSENFNQLYFYIEAWVNSVTGWMGKAPRFYNNPGQGNVYSLDVNAYYFNYLRSKEMSGKLSSALSEAADCVNLDGTTFSNVYNDIYMALLCFKYYSPKVSADYFYEAYRYTVNNRIVMPYVEFGARIIPLIKHLRSSKDARFTPIWLDKIQRLASQYEKNLVRLCSETEEKSIGLTAKERDVLALLAKGLKNMEISSYMNISASTTKDYTRKIYRKMGVKSRTEAVLLAQSMKII